MGLSLVKALALSATLQAPQSTQATLSGVVRDVETGRSLEGATVLLREAGQGALSGADGRYALRGVPPGPQHLTVSMLGYATRTIHALVPSSGRLEIDVALESKPIRLEGIEVVPAAVPPGLGHEPAERPLDRVRSASTVRSHPLLSEPDPLGALVGGEVVMDPEAPTGVVVRGGASDHTAYALDGIPVLDPLHAAGVFAAWNPDALAGVALSSIAPPVSLPEALSGVVLGTVRDAGPGFGTGVSLSTTHAALAAHGPLGGAAFVVSMRSGYPGLTAPKGDPTYLAGENGDALVKLGADALGGRLEGLYYDTESELTTGRLIDPPSGHVAGGGPLEWKSSSVGLTWRREARAASFSLKAWRAASRADATWVDGDPALAGPLRLESRREDLGVQAAARRSSQGRSTEVGLRLTRIATTYATWRDARPGDTRASMPLVTVFGEHVTALGESWEARLATSLAATPVGAHLSPRLLVSWTPAPGWSSWISVGRSHQFTQSLRNPESIAGHVFPAELATVAGRGDVPVPRSDQVAVGAEWRPTTGLRIAAQGYRRRIDGLVLVAPTDPGPFLTTSFVVGRASARGIALEAAGAGAHMGWLLGYGWQRVRRVGGTSAYAPAGAATHLVQGGVVAYPSATWALRIGVQGAAGRRSTDVAGTFEWEACNLRDGGCEFAGAPLADGSLGARALPLYLRIDIGARKHWDVDVAGRQSVIGVFGTVSNVLGRRNVLTYAAGLGGGLDPVTMRPLSPLVLGVDWRF